MAEYLRGLAGDDDTRVEPLLVVPELVDVGGGTWLEVLRWRIRDDEERLIPRAEEIDALHRMPGCLEDAERVDRGEVAST